MLSTLVALLALPFLAANSRTIDGVYTATVTDLPRTARELTIWIPLPVSGEHQTISDLIIDSPYQWHRSTDRDFGNEYIYTIIEKPNVESVTVRVHFRAVRTAHLLARASTSRISTRDLERNSRADRLVALSPRIRKLADEITAGATTPLAQARAIYDYVLATMSYDKTTPGWGRGDSERACDLRAGNCTDFHSLFMSLARSKGIPARFIIGFPMPEGSGRVAGYHCWAEFYVRGAGWIPVDPAEASTSADASRKAFLFGNLDADRVEFTTGRDIELDPPTHEPLNYFIYPYAEADGQPAGSTSISFEYKDVTLPNLGAGHATGGVTRTRE